MLMQITIQQCNVWMLSQSGGLVIGLANAPNVILHPRRQFVETFKTTQCSAVQWRKAKQMQSGMMVVNGRLHVAGVVMANSPNVILHPRWQFVETFKTTQCTLQWRKAKQMQSGMVVNG